MHVRRTGRNIRGAVALLLAALWPTTAAPAGTLQEESQAPANAGFSREILPILRERCFGCHQPAKAGGQFQMVRFDRLLAGGESGIPAVVPFQPEASGILDQIRPVDGKAAMPPDGPPLTDGQIALIERWIAEGALNDSTSTGAEYGPSHPPPYSRLPVITALAVSPDGKLLAVSGFHEVVLCDLSTGLVSRRLIGRSPRIESIAFSPDGNKLAISGGKPGEFGEIQIWDLPAATLLHSIGCTGDTLSGVSWSPDGKLLAFGGTDNTVRAVSAETGQQVLFQNVAEDWIRDTVFSADGSHLVSVGRDMTCKLTEVATSRFVDNVTSITPGVLKGGISSVSRHPVRDEILVGSADGVPKLYRIFRETKRVIGDDANLIRRFPAMTGRIHAIDYAPGGAAFAATSGLDQSSDLRIWSADFDTAVPDAIKAINSKTVDSRSAAERDQLEAFLTGGVKLVSEARFDGESLYALAFGLPGENLFVGGTSGVVREIEVATGKTVRELRLFETAAADATAGAETPFPHLPEIAATASGSSAVDSSSDPVRLVVHPPSIAFASLRDYCQLVVQLELADGSRRDVTSLVSIDRAADFISINNNRLVEPVSPGEGTFRVSMGELSAEVAVSAVGDLLPPVDFVRDVGPVLGRLGCNSGTCHGSQNGKRGFKLSLRGYDPLFDVRALTDDLSARRVNLAAPDDSLMLLKATGQVPHQGGVIFAEGGKYHRLIREWIAGGAVLDLSTPRVSRLTVEPPLPVLEDAGQVQQMRVTAWYSDGSSRDVTREAFLETSDQEVLLTDPAGRAIAQRRGEAALLARYEGAFAATTVTVMGPRPGWSWTPPEVHTPIDSFVAEKWKRMKIVPSELCSDSEFLRRVSLDLTGLPPSLQVVRDFLADPRPSREKRDGMVDSLIGSPEFIDHWTNKWADLLQVNRKFLAAEGAEKFHAWIRSQVAENVPHDRFVRSLLTASGSTADNPAANYFKILRTPEDAMENTTHLFLATRFNCNKCHDHPFERWTQDQYYQTAAWFSRIERKPDPASGDRTVGGSAVETATPLFELVGDAASGEMVHERTRAETAPRFPFIAGGSPPPDLPPSSRREEFANWLTAPDNRYFAASHANRIWGYLLGTGLIEPIDDIRASNPPSNPQLLEFLTAELVSSGFDTRHLIRMICKSRTYQLSVQTNPLNADDRTNYSHAIPRRLPAEVLYDSLFFVTGSPGRIPGLPPGTRASQLPDAAAVIPGGLLATLGRPARESACECERSGDLHLGSVLAMVSGPDQAVAIQHPENAIAETVSRQQEFREAAAELFLRFLGREATPDELAVAQESLTRIESDHARLLAEKDARAAAVQSDYEQRERERQQLLAAAETDLADWLAKTDPDLPAREAAHAATRNALQIELDGFESDLPGQLLAWRAEHAAGLQWHPVLAAELNQSNGGLLQRQADRSIIASDKPGNTVSEITVVPDLTRITAIRLEALSSPDLPSRGPGLAPNGNFVLHEFSVEFSTGDAPDRWTPVKLVQPLADFSQAGFDVANLVDGNPLETGWAVVPQTGQTHWATFQLATPLATVPGLKLRFALHQNYRPDDRHQLGRFRISLSSSPASTGLSLPEELLTVLVAGPEHWSDEQRTLLTGILRRGSPRILDLQRRLESARQPLMVEAGIVQRRQTVSQLSQPLPRDSELLRLEQDVARSSEQLQQQRLTAAQDLAWALINSPEFLFNH